MTWHRLLYSDDVASCLSCGAVYRLGWDGDPRAGYGDDVPGECSRDTDLAHGYDVAGECDCALCW